MYHDNPHDWEAIGRVHGEVFGEIRPASTMVVVAGLLDRRWRLEIEAEAILDDATDPPDDAAGGSATQGP
jgi:enamine deaminase RidA (YjgF/YER057c/UK114 family)